MLTPDAEDNGLPADPQVLYTWQWRLDNIKLPKEKIMCLNFRIRTASTVALTMMPFFVLAANAAMMSVSSTPPVIDNYDIASYGPAWRVILEIPEKR